MKPRKAKAPAIPETPPTFDELALRSRNAIKEMVVALGAEFEKRGATKADGISALMEGALMGAIEAYQDLGLALGVPVSVARDQLLKSVDAYWRQHLAARIKAQGEAALPPRVQ